MITLKNISINKYKCVETQQSFEVDEKITTLVGKNESGKTAILEAVAKSNYFEDDPKFMFNATYDYPRKEKKQFDKSGEDVEVITCTYEISRELMKAIQEDVGVRTFSESTVTYTKRYRSKNGKFGKIVAEAPRFIEHKLRQAQINDKDFIQKVKSLKTIDEIDAVYDELEAAVLEN